MTDTLFASLRRLGYLLVWVACILLFPFAILGASTDPDSYPGAVASGLALFFIIVTAPAWGTALILRWLVTGRRV